MQHVLVTGGAGFIGANFVHHLVRETSATVTVLDKLTYAASEAALAGLPADRVSLVVGDVAESADVDPLVAEHDAVVHFAAESHNDNSLDDPSPFIRTNLVGTFLTIKHAGAAMVADGGGSIVAVSSLAACTVHAWMSAYAASKAGVDALVRNAADELGPSGVRVNSVQPSLVDTELVAIPMGDPALLESYLTNMPVAHIGQPDEIASVIRFLAGPESGWVTGNAIPIDGGHHLRRGPDYGGISRFLYGDASTEPGYTGA